MRDVKLVSDLRMIVNLTTADLNQHDKIFNSFAQEYANYSFEHTEQ